ncbi:GspH/FimT family pseudopilin [Pseudomonas huaxiensis]|uniref:GspH/FimT family pseudopilin n=1 Tax=Pseudomonas huaxiensis TaxID=2213017 RepID=UPI001CDC0D74|nr:GspH/FimT family pseudopilin [Pseudomonas huaxiensis]
MRGQGGFTLIELLAVIALIGLASALLVNGLGRGVSAHGERQAIAELLQTLREARSQALLQQRQVSVAFDAQARCYRQGVKAQRCLPSTLGWTVHLALAADGRSALLRFHPDGSSSGGKLEVQSTTQVTRIDISWLTGIASVRQLQP